MSHRKSGESFNKKIDHADFSHSPHFLPRLTRSIQRRYVRNPKKNLVSLMNWRSKYRRLSPCLIAIQVLPSNDVIVREIYSEDSCVLDTEKELGIRLTLLSQKGAVSAMCGINPILIYVLIYFF